MMEIFVPLAIVGGIWLAVYAFSKMSTPEPDDETEENIEVREDMPDDNAKWPTQKNPAPSYPLYNADGSHSISPDYQKNDTEITEAKEEASSYLNDTLPTVISSGTANPNYEQN